VLIYNHQPSGCDCSHRTSGDLGIGCDCQLHLCGTHIHHSLRVLYGTYMDFSYFKGNMIEMAWELYLKEIKMN
jgi:hypothetical protein